MQRRRVSGLLVFILFLMLVMPQGGTAQEIYEAPSAMAPAQKNGYDESSMKSLREKSALRLNLKAPRDSSEVISLGPIDYEKEIQEGRISKSRAKGLQIGIHRAVEGFEDSKWRVFKGAQNKYNWRIVIHSPGAVSMRPHFSKLPDDKSEVYLYGVEGMDSIEGPIVNTNPPDGTWGPAISGEYLYIEVIQNSDSIAPSLRVDIISHDFRNTFSEGIMDPQLLKTGLLKEDTCYRDVNCYSDWNNTKTGVARMRYEKDGGAYVCTGALLTDQAQTFRNWFLTAYHCISTNAVASTLISYFNYRTNNCNGTPPSISSVPRVNGATYITGASADDANDFAFLELSSNPPAGTYYLGWTTSSIASGASVTSIHHPDGSYQRISFGNEENSSSIGTNWWRIIWHTSSTEGGSSGSPLFNSSRQIIGQLQGGTASCTDMSGYDRYGKFGISWNLGLSNYLGGTTPSTRSPVYRFFNTQTGTHFYTISSTERDTVINTYPQFRYENEAFYAFTSSQSGSSPVYRFFNTQTGTHFYTISSTERDTVINTYPQFRYENEAFYAFTSSQSGSSPVYRFFNTQTGTHFYTISSTERDTVINTYPQFRYENVAFYAFTSR